MNPWNKDDFEDEPLDLPRSLNDLTTTKQRLLERMKRLQATNPDDFDFDFETLTIRYKAPKTV